MTISLPEQCRLQFACLFFFLFVFGCYISPAHTRFWFQKTNQIERKRFEESKSFCVFSLSENVHTSGPRVERTRPSLVGSLVTPIKTRPLKQNEDGRVAADRHLPLFAGLKLLPESLQPLSVLKCTDTRDSRQTRESLCTYKPILLKTPDLAILRTLVQTSSAPTRTQSVTTAPLQTARICPL